MKPSTNLTPLGFLPDQKAANPSQSRHALLAALGNMPGNLKAKLVVEALEQKKDQGSDPAANSPGLSSLKSENNVSEALFLEVLKEFKSNLDHQHRSNLKLGSSGAPVSHPRHKEKNAGHAFARNTVHSARQKAPVYRRELVCSLEHEHPAVSAVVLSVMATDQAAATLKSMPASLAQKSTLQLSLMETGQVKVPAHPRMTILAVSRNN